MENAGKTLQKIKAKSDKQGVSEHVQDLINDRWKAVQELDINKAKELKKEIFKQRKIEQTIKKLESVKSDIDVTSKWLGIRYMKEDHKPIPYAIRKSENGRKDIVKIKDKAEVATTHLENTFWEKTEEDHENNSEENRGKIVNENLNYRIGK